MPFAASTPLDTSTAHGLHAPDRVGDVLGSEPAGQHDRQRQRARDQAPVEDRSGAAVQTLLKGVEQQRLGACENRARIVTNRLPAGPAPLSCRAARSCAQNSGVSSP